MPLPHLFHRFRIYPKSHNAGGSLSICLVLEVLLWNIDHHLEWQKSFVPKILLYQNIYQLHFPYICMIYLFLQAIFVWLVLRRLRELYRDNHPSSIQVYQLGFPWELGLLLIVEILCINTSSVTLESFLDPRFFIECWKLTWATRYITGWGTRFRGTYAASIISSSLNGWSLLVLNF